MADKPQAAPRAPVADTAAQAADLSEPAPGVANAMLPRIGADGRAPRRVFAARFDSKDLRPRVGVMIAGIGMSEADSMSAIETLPHGISLAVTAGATGIDRILDAARRANDEIILSVPMEPQGYPLNDPDDRHALMSSLEPAENLKRLYWAMSRISGYVGVTNAIGEMRGERFSGVADQLNAVLADIGGRGLLFVDARAGAPRLPLAWNRSVSVIVDPEASSAAELDSRLNALSQIALDKGSALGLVSLPRPRTLERVAAWSTTLAAKGLALAPVSALVTPPATEDFQEAQGK